MLITRVCRNIPRKFVRLSSSNSKHSKLNPKFSAIVLPSSWLWCSTVLFLVVFLFGLFLILSSWSWLSESENLLQDPGRSQIDTFSALHQNQTYSSALKKPSTILCYVLLSQGKLAAARAIKETWGTKCDKLIFFGRFNNTELPVQFVDTKEGYRFLWGKTKAALKHLQTNYNKLYDWYLKADDDTFVVIENLRHFVQNLDHKSPIWFGYKLRHPRAPSVPYMSGGSGYVYSQKALERVTATLFGVQSLNTSTNNFSSTNPHKGKCNVQSIYGIEDLELGNCFLESGVTDVNTADEQGRERFLPLPIETLWRGNVPKIHWLWRQAWNPLKLGAKCCSSEIISTHQISPAQMRLLFKVLYIMKRLNNTVADANKKDNTV